MAVAAIAVVVRRRFPRSLGGLGRAALGAVTAGISACKQTGLGLTAETAGLACLLAKLLAQGAIPGVRIAVAGAVVAVVGCGVVVLFIKAELWLDGRRVNAVCVQASPNCASELHVACRTLTLEVIVHLHVERSNQFGITELPDMKVVAAQDSREVDDIALNILNVDASGSGLEKNAGSGLAKRDGGAENDDGDDQRNQRIRVETPRVVSEPDDQSRSDDTNVA